MRTSPCLDFHRQLRDSWDPNDPQDVEVVGPSEARQLGSRDVEKHSALGLGKENLKGSMRAGSVLTNPPCCLGALGDRLGDGLAPRLRGEG
jgi:hypothetical protein